jgi:WD40 repeat protein
MLSVYALEGVCGNCLLKPGLEVMPEVGSALGTGSDSPGTTGKLSRFGDYELIEEIARGGMGIVYRARQVSLDRIVAVKMLLAGQLAGKDFVQRFRTEAAAAASLQHPNIVAIHEVGFAQGQHFFAMDYVEGMTLAQLVAKGPLPGRKAATYLKIIAEAIHFAHERNVLHRDLKPSIDSSTDQPRITDFGLAKRLEAETELTLSGQLLGSPNYVSPEQAAGKRGTIGKRSDVYSLGSILYHLLTGRPPFQGETLAEVFRQLADNDPPAPSLLTPKVPRDLETICLKCLQKEPSRRYQSARQLAEELGRFLQNKPIEARPIGRAERGWRWCRRNSSLASLMGAAGLIFALGFGGTLWQWRHAVRYAAEEVKQRKIAQDNQERADRNLYDSDMSLAQHRWDDGDLGGTLHLLETHQPNGTGPDRRGFEWYYFWNLCKGDPRITLGEHSNIVNCLAFSPDGKQLATGAVGDSVLIRDSASGKVSRKLPERDVTSLCFSPDGQSLAISGQDRMAVWNLKTEREIFKLEERTARYRAAFAGIGALLVVGRDDALRRFGRNGGSAELWNYATKEREYVFPHSGGYIAVAPRVQRLATANWENATKIWDLNTRHIVQILPTGGVRVMALSWDGSTLATSGNGSEIALWDIATARSHVLAKHQSVSALAFSRDGQFLASGGNDQMVSVWDIAAAQEAERFRGHRSEVVSVDFSGDGQVVASGGKDNLAMLWNLHAVRAPASIRNVISRPVFSPDGRRIAAGIRTGGVAVWNVATLELESVFPGVRDPVAFADTGRALITRGTNDFLKTFDLITGEVRETIAGPVAEEKDEIALSPDGKILAVGLTDGTLNFFDAKTGALLASLPQAFPGQIFQLIFSPDGKVLAGAGRHLEGGEPPAAKIWDVASRRLIRPLLGHTDTVLGASFSPDGALLATCGGDNSIKYWDTTTWEIASSFTGQRITVNTVAFLPTGKTLASTSFEGTLRFWNAATQRELASLKIGASAEYILFSPDGETLAAFCWDGSLQIWRAPIPRHSREDSWSK